MAAALKSEPAADLLDIAASHLAQGHPNEALEAASQALLQRDDAEARALFVACMGSADRLPSVPGFASSLTRRR